MCDKTLYIYGGLHLSYICRRVPAMVKISVTRPIVLSGVLTPAVLRGPGGL